MRRSFVFLLDPSRRWASLAQILAVIMHILACEEESSDLKLLYLAHLTLLHTLSHPGSEEYVYPSWIPDLAAAKAKGSKDQISRWQRDPIPILIGLARLARMQS